MEPAIGNGIVVIFTIKIIPITIDELPACRILLSVVKTLIFARSFKFTIYSRFSIQRDSVFIEIYPIRCSDVSGFT